MPGDVQLTFLQHSLFRAQLVDLLTVDEFVVDFVLNDRSDVSPLEPQQLFKVIQVPVYIAVSILHIFADVYFHAQLDVEICVLVDERVDLGH